MNLEFETNFTVMPTHANHMYPMIFGGAFFSKLDLAAAQCVNRFLHDSECEGAVTHKSNVTFFKPCYVGDLIYIKAHIKEPRVKAILVVVEAEREKRGSSKRDKVAEAEFVFVSIDSSKDVAGKPDMLPYAPHGLSL